MKTVMTFRQRTEALDIIRAHCHTANGLAVYDEGWSDLRVATELGIPAALAGVKKVRKEMFGQLRPASLPKAEPAAAADIEALTKRLDALERNVGELGQHVVKLHDMMEAWNNNARVPTPAKLI